MKVSDYIFGFPFARLKTYFREAREEIAATNLSYLRFASTATLILLVLNLFLASALIRDWTPSVYHIAFLPTMLAFSILKPVYINYHIFQHFIPQYLSMAICCAASIFLDTIDSAKAIYLSAR